MKIQMVICAIACAAAVPMASLSPFDSAQAARSNASGLTSFEFPLPCGSNRPHGTMEGYVTVDGLPPPYAEIRLGNGDCGAWASTRSDGGFEMKWAPVGRRTLSARLWTANRWTDVGPVEIDTNTTLYIEIFYRSSVGSWEIYSR